MSGSNPAPMTVRQLRALAVSAARELRWGLWSVKAELAMWRARAEAIPDPSTRRYALAAMEDGRALVDGAALFWTLPGRRRPELLRLLAAFQTLLNFIDLALEREARGPEQRPRSWIWLAREALDITRPPPIEKIERAVGGDDGGYLCALVLACRAGCSALPHYASARPLLLREADRARAFEIEHDRNAPRRLAMMEAYAEQAFGEVHDATWWELAGGASSLLTAMALLGLAGDERTTPEDLREAADAYVWVASAAALLDSYVDQPADALTGAHNWFDYYSTQADATRRTTQLLRRAVIESSALRNGERHVVIVTSMAALALSSDTARSRPRQADTATLARSGGCTTRALIPILRAWRLAYQRTAD
jgi:tetraprenyl-beta-curcumene synthase